MSKSLHLFPIDNLEVIASSEVERVSGYSHTVLNAPLGLPFDEIDALRPKRLPRRHQIYGIVAGRISDGRHAGEHTDGRFTRDPWGDRYTWVRADELGEVLARSFPFHPVTAYIRALRADCMIVLGWH